MNDYFSLACRLSDTFGGPQIAIPLETICSISLSTHLEFAETIRIVVTDPTEGYSTDEYWLAYFSDLHGALARLQEGLVDWRERKGVSGPPEGEELEKVVVDTNVGTGSKEKGKEKDKKETWGATISSRLRLFPSSSSPSTPLAPSSPTAITQPLPEHLEASSATLRSTTPLPRPPPPPTSIDHRYPPEPSSTVTPPSSILAATSIQPSSWTHTLAGALPPVPLPSWLRSAASSAVAPFAGAPGMRRIVEIVDDRREGRSSSSSRGRTAGRKARNDDLSRSVWDDAAERPDEEEEDEDRGEKEVDERFRKAFGVTEKEVVVAREFSNLTIEWSKPWLMIILLARRLPWVPLPRAANLRQALHINQFPVLQVGRISGQDEGESSPSLAFVELVLTRLGFR